MPKVVSEERVIFHVDMDAFYASVEQLEHPEWRGLPLIVGGVHSNRGVVSSASYEARAFGVRSAMPVREARQRCPHGIFTEGRHGVYRDYSRRLMDVFDGFSPRVEQVSIDEAFLDMTGTHGLFGPPPAAAKRLKQAVFDQLELRASVGVAPNKFLAKIASDIEKPNGLTVVIPSRVEAFLDPLPVERLMGVGRKTVPDLHRQGLYTIGQVRRFGIGALTAAFGEGFGAQLDALSHGEDPREIETGTQEKSLSHEITFEEDVDDAEELGSVLLELCDRVARRARKHDLSGRTVTLVWRNPDFTRHSRSQSLAEPTQHSRTLFAVAEPWLRELQSRGKPSAPRRFRLLGVRLSGFAEGGEQLSLFGPPPATAALDRVADVVRNRFGEGSILPGRVVRKPE